MRTLLCAALTLALIACGPSAVKPSPSPSPTVGIRDGGPHASACMELFVRAETSPTVVVPGAFACVDASLRPAFAPVSDDASLAAFAATDPIFTHYEVCGAADNGFWYFDLSNPDSGEHIGLRLMVSGSDHIIHINFAEGVVPVDSCQFAPVV